MPREQAKVWIELEKPAKLTQKQRDDIIAKANRMVRRLAAPDGVVGRFSWDSKRAQYAYETDSGYETLGDNGKWFNLDYFGRE